MNWSPGGSVCLLNDAVKLLIVCAKQSQLLSYASCRRQHYLLTGQQ